MPHDLARIEEVFHRLLTPQAKLEFPVEEKLLPVPLVDEDRLFPARVLVGLEETADFLLVEVGIVATPSRQAIGKNSEATLLLLGGPEPPTDCRARSPLAYRSTNTGRWSLGSLCRPDALGSIPSSKAP